MPAAAEKKVVVAENDIKTLYDKLDVYKRQRVVRPAELHSLSAEENWMTENVASLRSVKVATPPWAAKEAIPCGLAIRKRF